MSLLINKTEMLEQVQLVGIFLRTAYFTLITEHCESVAEFKITFGTPHWERYHQN